MQISQVKWKKPSDALAVFKGKYVICSECNVMLPVLKELYRYDFCPRCGAKMDGGN